MADIFNRCDAERVHPTLRLQTGLCGIKAARGVDRTIGDCRLRNAADQKADARRTRQQIWPNTHDGAGIGDHRNSPFKHWTRSKTPTVGTNDRNFCDNCVKQGA